MLKNIFRNFDWNQIISKEEKKELEFGISITYATLLLLFTSITGIIIVFSNIIIGLAIVILGVIYFWYLAKGKHFLLTDNRIILVDVFVGREVISVDYSQITDIELEQSPFDQMGGWGTLSINTAGTHSPTIKITPVNNPQKIKQELDNIRQKKINSITPSI
jgi:membrane protein YdbS with pleckstrin-like domain